MSYRPQFTITPALLARVEAIAVLRERIQGAAVQVAWIPALQKDTRARNAHSSTAIEGNPLTLEQVRAVEEGEPLSVPARVRREVVNYFAALRHIEKRAAKKRIAHEDVLRLHRIIAGEVMDQGEAVAVANPEMEPAEFYKASALKVLARGAETSASPPPWLGAPPVLETYRARGHRRLDARTYEAKCRAGAAGQVRGT